MMNLIKIGVETQVESKTYVLREEGILTPYFEVYLLIKNNEYRIGLINIFKFY
jgi:hypothetical protein